MLYLFLALMLSFVGGGDDDDYAVLSYLEMQQPAEIQQEREGEAASISSSYSSISPAVYAKRRLR